MGHKRHRKPRAIRLHSNEFWGKRSGTIHKLMGRIFKLKRWAMGKQNGQLASRKGRTYKNAKLSRPSALGFAQVARKGAKVIQ